MIFINYQYLKINRNYSMQLGLKYYTRSFMTILGSGDIWQCHFSIALSYMVPVTKSNP